MEFTVALIVKRYHLIFAHCFMFLGLIYSAQHFPSKLPMLYRSKQELSYCQQTARQLRTQYAEGIGINDNL